MTIRLNIDRKPIGYCTWVAYFRDGAVLQEFFSEQDENGEWIDHPQVSFDVVAARDDVAQVHLIPIDDQRRSYVRIDVAEGERVAKKATRHIPINAETGEEVEPPPPIDCYMLITDKPIWHYSYHDGSMIITTAIEP